MCCGKIRSNIRDFLIDGFIPPPYPVVQTHKGLVIPPPSESKNTKFANLFTRLTFKKTPIKYTIKQKEIPYDLYCPSVSSDLDRRVCQECGAYFATISAVNKHSQSIHGSRVKSKCKVKSIIRRRKEEILCIVDQPNQLC